MFFSNEYVVIIYEPIHNSKALNFALYILIDMLTFLLLLPIHINYIYIYNAAVPYMFLCISIKA